MGWAGSPGWLTGWPVEAALPHLFFNEEGDQEGTSKLAANDMFEVGPLNVFHSSLVQHFLLIFWDEIQTADDQKMNRNSKENRSSSEMSFFSSSQ